ncbi:MAG: bifunctional tetrahydrofolate synthase/dihydrofolate synthase [Gammaproteobacteria bacterium]|nr:bifunctional tetrahydrofolate synthase/dihydrofolate synthase [Gammaproteobacteria bacterium]
MRFSTLAEWLQWQEKLHPKSIDLGLERSRKTLNQLKLNTPKHLTITVAGTNGKGSTIAILESILLAAGYSVGSYTSPHLLHYNERIKINGTAVNDEAICHAFDEIDQARGEISLTYFEFGTLAAFSIFQQERVDIALLEVGLGGRLDTVNLLNPDLAIITAIDIDHTAWLGPDRESIGKEKAGIMRKGIPVICSDPHPPASLIESAEKIGASLELLGRDYDYKVADDGSWALQHPMQNIDSLPGPNLMGEAQYQNCAGAIAALLSLGNKIQISSAIVAKGLQKQTLPGRFQRIGDSPLVILDVAHNPQSARHLANNLHNLPCGGKRYAVVAMLSDKDQQEILMALSGLFDHWMAAGLDVDRGDSGDSIVTIIKSELSESVNQFDSVAEAYQSAMDLAASGDQIIVFGSFFTVSDILELELAKTEGELN